MGMGEAQQQHICLRRHFADNFAACIYEIPLRKGRNANVKAWRNTFLCLVGLSPWSLCGTPDTLVKTVVH